MANLLKKKTARSGDDNVAEAHRCKQDFAEKQSHGGGLKSRRLHSLLPSHYHEKWPRTPAYLFLSSLWIAAARSLSTRRFTGRSEMPSRTEFFGQASGCHLRGPWALN
jgi:hypothetical protein